MPSREYSKRLGVISDDQLQRALDRFDLGRFISAAPITGGLFGQNLFLTSDRGEYVLRGCPHYDWQFPKERFFADLLHEHTAAPTPWPYMLDPNDDIFGWSYLVMPRLPGLQIGDPTVGKALSAEDQRGIARALGETLAELHCLTWTHCGEYDLTSDTIQPLSVDYAEWVVARIREELALAACHSDRTTPEDIAWVEGLVAQGRDALAVPFQPGFVMRDFRDGNTTAQCQDGVWRISGVFDLMECYMGDGEADLVRMSAVYIESEPKPALAAIFVGAYADARAAHGRPTWPGFAERWSLHMLLDRLIVWEYGQRTGPAWWEPTLSLREWAEPFTAMTVL